ncbi:MAG: flagellar biosynthesis protein FlhF [Deferribacteraceae bacterium]|jgi:flagellar biosynthesis protein FlhF|nr:flagellar biosynthesis protein FlhF [Deferribacteraceae bacterium]
MKIKKYEVTDMKEALKQIKNDLGPHAVILSTRKIMKPTGLGLFPRPLIEVTAVDLDKNAAPQKTPLSKKQPSKQVSSPPLVENTYGSNITPTAPEFKRQPEPVHKKPDIPEDFDDDDDIIRTLLEEGRGKFPQSSKNVYEPEVSDLLPKEGEEFYVPPDRISAFPHHNPAYPEKAVADKITEMFTSFGLDKISTLADDINDIKKELAEIKSRESSANITVDIPDNLKEYYALLIKNGVDDILAYRFLKSASVKIPDIPGRAQLKNIIQQELAAMIPSEEDYLVPLRNKVSFFVGPTGVGKTTTIAKIAADLVLRFSQRVCLITTDMFRIGAVEQLKTYADIVDLKLYVATNPEELTHIVSEVSEEYDYMLMDSTGRSPYDNINIGDIAAYTGASPLVTPVLVLSMAANHAELGEMYERFSELNPAYIIFTKLDETRYFGPLLNIPVKKKKSILLLSAGQKVPDDMEMPDGKKIAKKLFQEIPALWNDN